MSWGVTVTTSTSIGPEVAAGTCPQSLAGSLHAAMLASLELHLLQLLLHIYLSARLSKRSCSFSCSSGAGGVAARGHAGQPGAATGGLCGLPAAGGRLPPGEKTFLFL